MDVQELPKAPFTIFGSMRLTGDRKKIPIFFQFAPHSGTVEANT